LTTAEQTHQNLDDRPLTVGETATERIAMTASMRIVLR